MRWSLCLRLSWRQLCGQLTAYAPEVTHQNGDGLRTNQSQWQSPHHLQQGGIRHRLGFSWDFPEFYQGTVVGIINRKPYAVYINAHSALRSSLIKMMWCLRRVHGILTCSVLSTRRRSSVTLPSGLRGILTCRVLSTRRRRAVRLPSGLRVLFSQLLFCLVHVTQSSCPLKDAQAFQLVLRSSM